MKKKWSRLAAAAAVCLCLTACGKKQDPDTDSSQASQKGTEAAEILQESDAVVQEPEEETNPQRPIIDRIEEFADDEITHIIDEAGVMSGEEKKQINALAQALSSCYLMEAAVVVTDDLEGESPSAFAKAYYQTLYGKGTTGLLVLINNDTYEDYVYTAGACSLYITAEEKSLAIAKATPDLVEGNYGAALTTLLTLGESMPEIVFDRSNTWTREQTDAVSEMASEALGDSEESWCVLLTNTVYLTEDEEQASDKALKAYAQSQRTSLQADGLLVIDVDAGLCTIVSKEEWKQADSLTEEIAELLDSDTEDPITESVELYYSTLTK